MPSESTGASEKVSGAFTPSFPHTPGHRPGTRGYRRANLALFAAGVATFILLYAPQALLPALSAELGASPARASLTVSVTTVCLAVAVLPVSALSERWGRTRVMTVSVFAAALIGLLVPLAPDLTTLVLLRAAQGVALAGLPATAMAYLAEEVDPRAVTSAIGLYVAGNSIGGMSSRVIPGAVSEWLGWRAALAAVGVLSLLLAVVFRALLPRARHFRPGPVHPRALLGTVRGHLSDPLLCRLYAIGLLLMTAFGAVYTVLGYRLTAEPFGLPQSVVGLVFLVYLVGTASSAAAGRLAGRLGRRGALYVGILTAAAGLLLSVSAHLGAVLLGLVLITAGFFAGHAVASSSVSRTATRGRAQATALYLAAYYVGNGIGGTLGAATYHSAGWNGTVAVGLTALTAAGGITLYATRKALLERRTRAMA
ncbi:MFS transporter [Streptomyces capparidis]